MSVRKLHVGERFGRLLVVEDLPRVNGQRARVRTLCDCGRETTPISKTLRDGRTRSCGCRQGSGSVGAGDPMASTRNAWARMRGRCSNPRAKDWAGYGGRGIKVCDRWATFDLFLEDMGLRPLGLSIDRIDNDGNYEPTNCRWALPKMQARNRRSNRLIAIGDKTQCLAQWCEELGLNYSRTNQRLQRGWPVQQALEMGAP